MAELSIDSGPRMKLLRFEPPAQRQKGIRVKDVAELVAALRARGLFQ
jgi:electron transfer flavoprotein beta subunit